MRALRGVRVVRLLQWLAGSGEFCAPGVGFRPQGLGIWINLGASGCRVPKAVEDEGVYGARSSSRV